MRRAYTDETPEIALGAVDREWRDMAKLAVIIREGRCNPRWAAEHEKKFTGIFKRLLEDPIEEVKREAGRGHYA